MRSAVQTPVPSAHAPPVGRRDDGLTLAIAIASAGAGALHLSAAVPHREHPLVFAFFVLTGVVQLVLAGLIVHTRGDRRVLVPSAALNVSVIGVWLASRLWGLPFIPGADHAEPFGTKDTAAALLELLVVVGALLAVSRRPRAPIPTGPLAVATAVVIAAGLVAPAHHHPGHAGHSDLAAHGQGDEAHEDHGDEEHGHSRDSAHASGHGARARAHGHAADDPTHAAAHDGGKRHPHPSATAHGAHAAAARSGDKALPRANGISAKVRYGPFVLPPARLGGAAHYNRVFTNVAKPCTDCYLVEVVPDLTYADGSPANLDTGPMLHHAVWTRPAVTDTTCRRDTAIGSQGMRFFASGNERTPMRMPAGFGYKVGNDGWNLIVEVMNHSDTTRNVYLTLDVKYQPASAALSNVTPVWLDVDNCGDSQYSVPAGRSETRWAWTSKLTGRIVSAGGHVHDGGVKVVLANETTGKQVCSSVAGYGTDPRFAGSVESMSTCIWDRIGTVRAGEILAIRSYYESSQAQDDVMGIVLAFVFETNDLAGGSSPPSSRPPPDPDPPPVHDH